MKYKVEVFEGSVKELETFLNNKIIISCSYMGPGIYLVTYE